MEKDSLQAAAVKKRRVPDVGDTAGDSDGGQLGAVAERAIPNVRDAAGEGDRSQVRAATESRAPNAGDAVWDRIVSKSSAGALPKHGEVFVEQDPIQVAKGWISRVHKDRCKAGAVGECIGPDKVTPPGIVTLVRLEQYRNAERPMFVTPLGRVMFASFWQR